MYDKAVLELVDSGLNTLVDQVIARDDPGLPFKGDPELYRQRLRELWEEHGEVLVIGDVASLDLEPAHTEGCSTCLVARPYTPQRSRELPWLDHVVESLDAIPPLVADR